jgi:protoheme IX farnesyltransferase
MIHAFMAQLFFGLTVGLAVLTSPGWLSGSDLKSQTSDWKGVSIRHWCAASTAAIYVQLILGAAFRHRGIGIIPHVVGAIVVTVLVAWTAFSVFRHYAQVASLKRPAALAGGSLAIQMILGVAAYLARVASYDDPQPLQPMVGLTVAHLAGGAAVLAAMLVLTLRAFQTLKTQDSRPKTQDGSEDRRSRIEDRNRSLSILDPPSSTLDFRRGSWVLGLRSYLELTKPRITLLILLTAVAGFWMGSKSPLDLVGLLHTAVGIGLLSAGIATLNQYLERKLDGLMMRTASRPLPSQRLTPAKALWFGATMAVGAEIYLAFLVNPLTAVLGLIALGSYLFVYTPLKTRTTLCTAIGAIPGAMPPLMGWTAARGELGIEAWILFSILFLWQFPHFLSIAWLYRDDYARAGIRMLPVVEREGKVTGEQIVAYSFMLLPVSLLPALLGLSGPVYLFGALALGLVFLYVSIRAAVALRHSFKAGYRDARRLLLASVVYLPLLFGLMVIGK